MSSPAVQFHNVSKKFRMGASHDSIRDLLSHQWSKLLGKGNNKKENATFWALKNVNFSVQSSEAVGIIGPNGAGKSTVLKLLAKILRPDTGSINVRGRMAALIEVGAGFHGDLTGRENIDLNGAILGMSREEIRKKMDAIVSFAGIEKFLDMPVKRYSSGMYARLGFSIAAHVEPDVLLVDEVLSVGDAVFRLRCFDRMRELVRGGTTLVFVTHNLDQMQSICPTAVVLEQGQTMFQGNSREAVSHYMDAMSRCYANRPADMTELDLNENSCVEVTGLQFLNHENIEMVWVKPHEPIRVQLKFKLHRPIPKLVVELNMRAKANENLLSLNSGRDDCYFDGQTGEHCLTLSLPEIPVSSGQYLWNIRMWDAHSGHIILDTPFNTAMVVDDGGRATGALCLDHQWEMKPTQPETVSLIAEAQVDHDLLGDQLSRNTPESEHENRPVR